MKKYELKLRHNNQSIVVGSYACGRSVNVAINTHEYQSIQWGGFIDYEAALMEPKTDYVYVACFYGNNAFRQTDEYEWQYVNSVSPLFLICMIDVDRTYAIFKDGEPLLVNMNRYDGALPIRYPREPASSEQNNTYTLLG